MAPSWCLVLLSPVKASMAGPSSAPPTDRLSNRRWQEQIGAASHSCHPVLAHDGAPGAGEDPPPHLDEPALKTNAQASARGLQRRTRPIQGALKSEFVTPGLLAYTAIDGTRFDPHSPAVHTAQHRPRRSDLDRVGRPNNGLHRTVPQLVAPQSLTQVADTSTFQ